MEYIINRYGFVEVDKDAEEVAEEAAEEVVANATEFVADEADFQ